MQYNEFPEFVPDQLLMSDHLNQVFNYLDEQERLTRTCLIGIGIVCGLQLHTNGAGTSITITQGCGVTSSGFLVQVPTTAYTEYVTYDPVKARYYDRFVDLGTKTKKFDLYELVQAGVVEESQPLTDAFIADKVVLLFVELLEESSKNCDPNSCDDKGIEVTVTFRPLLVAKADAAALMPGSGGGSASASYSDAVLKLPELRMRRADVPATSLVDTAAVFQAFLLPLSNAFLELVEKVLAKTYATFVDLVADVYPSNPFAGLAFNYRFLSTHAMTPAQLLHTQYYYDLFSDVLLSYEELRRTARGITGVCCPDDTFPRHLLLGEAKGYTPLVHSDYRHYFIPSPLLAQQPSLLGELRSLVVRLALLVNRFSVPAIAKTGGALPAEFVRLTPSSLGEVPLSRKAIPYYYAVTQTPNPLYQLWDRAKTRVFDADKNLSYHATEYNTHDDMIRQPLLYDLEPYNFLRAEGHIGQPYTAALDSVLKQKAKYRLPIEVIALSTDVSGLLATLRSASGATLTSLDAAALARAECHFNDLEALYAALEDRLICFLCKEMKYYYDIPTTPDGATGDATLVPAVQLLMRCDPNYRYQANTYGQLFESWIGGLTKLSYMPSGGILASSVFSTSGPVFAAAQSTPLIKTAAIAAPQLRLTEVQPSFVIQLVLYLLYYMEQLSETLQGSLAAFDSAAFEQRFDDLQQVAKSIKSVLAQQTGDVLAPKTEDALDHLDKLIYACDATEFRSLAAEFQKRWLALESLRRLAYYARKCPSLQHKAGVPMGGTLVLVYHEITAATNAFSIRKFSSISTGSSSTDMILNELQSSLAAGTKSGLDDLIQEIPNGTVIADFYFPFICCSDCPPIKFEVAAPAPPPPPPQISITPTEFCNSDKGPIAISASPDGGTLTGEGTSSDANAGLVFVPAAVDVGNNSSKDVQLTYTVAGATATETVKVFHNPTAAFQLAPNPTVGPGHVDAVDASTFASGYSWDFGDGTPAVTTKKASHDYQQSGSYVVTLTVTNGPCSATQSATISIQLELPTARLCIPLPALSEEFKNLPQLNAQVFPAFQKQVAAFPQIEALFGDLAAAGDLAQADEIAFHVNHKTATLLRTWLAQLQVIILENTDLRLLALELYRILADLVLRIACFQDEDLDTAKVPTAALFKLATGHVGQWPNVQAQTAPASKERIKILLGDVQHELDRLKADEAKKKPKYATALATLLKALTAYPF